MTYTGSYHSIDGQQVLLSPLDSAHQYHQYRQHSQVKRHLLISAVTHGHEQIGTTHNMQDAACILPVSYPSEGRQMLYALVS